MRLALAAALALIAAVPVRAATTTRAPFGALPDGRAVEMFTLKAQNGVTVKVMTLGATLQSVSTPDRAGRLANVALGHATASEYLSGTEYFGATVGRYANRIAQGRFTLDGKVHQLPINNPPNSLHGGTDGFNRRLWTVAQTGDGNVTLKLVSPDGDQGYPGTLTVTATYALADDGTLTLDYRATTTARTIVNLTNHSYWNLGGEGSPVGALGQSLTVYADSYLPVDATLIPTGEFRRVAGTPFNFLAGPAIGPRVRDAHDQQIAYARGYDHTFVIARTAATSPRRMARLEDLVAGRVLELWATDPGLQVYSGNFLDGTAVGTSGKLYRMGDGVALVPQRFPDTPNQPNFGSARLDPGQEYQSRIVYRFGVS